MPGSIHLEGDVESPGLDQSGAEKVSGLGTLQCSERIFEDTLNKCSHNLGLKAALVLGVDTVGRKQP